MALGYARNQLRGFRVGWYLYRSDRNQKHKELHDIRSRRIFSDIHHIRFADWGTGSVFGVCGSLRYQDNMDDRFCET